MDAERPFSQLWESNAAYFSSGIRIQLERPYNAIARGGIVRCWLETPVAYPYLCHVKRKIAPQLAAVKPR